MKKFVFFGFIAAFLSTGCSDDKKAVIPTNLTQATPKVATSGGGGDNPQNAANKAKPGQAKGPGGQGSAD